jgi:hypothetical protein
MSIEQAEIIINIVGVYEPEKPNKFQSLDYDTQVCHNQSSRRFRS